MSETATIQHNLGYQAPDFTLPDTIDGQQKSLTDLKGEKASVVAFICNHCPYVVHILDKFIDVALQYQPKGIAFIAISSNDVENYPQDAPDKMQALGRKHKFPFPYLYDASQDVAKAYKAACTPDMSIFNADLSCVYRGQFDGSRPGSLKPVTGKSLTTALDQLLDFGKITVQQLPSIGCNIKWKA